MLIKIIIYILRNFMNNPKKKLELKDINEDAN